MFPQNREKKQHTGEAFLARCKTLGIRGTLHQALLEAGREYLPGGSAELRKHF